MALFDFDARIRGFRKCAHCVLMILIMNAVRDIVHYCITVKVLAFISEALNY